MPALQSIYPPDLTLMPNTITIRAATPDDAAAIQSIYAPYVTATVISFEETPPNQTEMANRITNLLDQGYPYLVAERGSELAGYAYASPHRMRHAYRKSIDVTVYVAPDAHRQGVGCQLYEALLSASAERGYHAAFAGITLPNPASIGLHEALNFTHVGTYREVGHKFGKWHDVGWWQRLL